MGLLKNYSSCRNQQRNKFDGSGYTCTIVTIKFNQFSMLANPVNLLFYNLLYVLTIEKLLWLTNTSATY